MLSLLLFFSNATEARVHLFAAQRNGAEELFLRFEKPMEWKIDVRFVGLVEPDNYRTFVPIFPIETTTSYHSCILMQYDIQDGPFADLHRNAMARLAEERSINQPSGGILSAAKGRVRLYSKAHYDTLQQALGIQSIEDKPILSWFIPETLSSIQDIFNNLRRKMGAHDNDRWPWFAHTYSGKYLALNNHTFNICVLNKLEILKCKPQAEETPELLKWCINLSYVGRVWEWNQWKKWLNDQQLEDCIRNNMKPVVGVPVASLILPPRLPDGSIDFVWYLRDYPNRMVHTANFALEDLCELYRRLSGMRLIEEEVSAIRNLQLATAKTEFAIHHQRFDGFQRINSVSQWHQQQIQDRLAQCIQIRANVLSELSITTLIEPPIFT